MYISYYVVKNVIICYVFVSVFCFYLANGRGGGDGGALGLLWCLRAGGAGGCDDLKKTYEIR